MHLSCVNKALHTCDQHFQPVNHTGHHISIASRGTEEAVCVHVARRNSAPAPRSHCGPVADQLVYQPGLFVIRCCSAAPAQASAAQQEQPRSSLVASLCLWLWRVLRVMVYSRWGTPAWEL